MANVTIDKKQLPQVAVLGVLSLGLFGFFVLKMVGPPATQAAAPVAAKTPTGANATGSTAGAATTDGPSASALIGAVAPSPGMRDPFTSTVIAAPSAPTPAVHNPAAVSAMPSVGEVQPLPTPNGVPAAPALPAPSPAWSVTGVICSDATPGAAIAIFRLGDERHYIRLGGMIDDTTRLIGIDRGGVTILHAGTHIRLPLGAPVVAAPPKAEPLAQPTGAFAPTTQPAAETAPVSTQAAPAAPAPSASSIADTLKPS